MDDKDRIEFLIHDKGLSNVEFSAITGIAPATISHITSGRSKPTLPILKGILNGFPDLNPEWVFLGIGPMYKINKEEEGQDAANSDDAPDLFSSLPRNEKPYNGASQNGKNGFSGSNMVNSADLKEVIRDSMVAAISQRKRQIVEVRIFFDDGTYEAFNTPKPKA